MAKFQIAIEKTLNAEGGYINSKDDSGGETNFGITIAVARASGYKDAMSEMPIEIARIIYKAKYWDPLHLDEINDQDVANVLYDIAVLSGVTVATVFAQISCNVLNGRGSRWKDIIIDGVVSAYGPTVVAINIASKVCKGELLKALDCMKGHRFMMLCLSGLSDAERRLLSGLNELDIREQPTDKNETFLVGWLRNRIEI